MPQRTLRNLTKGKYFVCKQETNCEGNENKCNLTRVPLTPHYMDTNRGDRGSQLKHSVNYRSKEIPEKERASRTFDTQEYQAETKESEWNNRSHQDGSQQETKSDRIR
jgi:hypothetical protein